MTYTEASPTRYMTTKQWSYIRYLCQATDYPLPEGAATFNSREASDFISALKKRKEKAEAEAIRHDVEALGFDSRLPVVKTGTSDKVHYLYTMDSTNTLCNLDAKDWDLGVYDPEGLCRSCVSRLVAIKKFGPGLTLGE